MALLWPGCAHTARGKIRCRGGIGPDVGTILRWGGAARSPRPRQYTGKTHSTGELGTGGALVAAADRHGWASGGAAAAAGVRALIYRNMARFTVR